MDISPFWFGLALGGGGMLIVSLGFALLRLKPSHAGLTPQELSDLKNSPKTPLQKRAWSTLLLGTAVLVLLAITFITMGTATFHENIAMRLVVYALFLGGVMSNLLLFMPARRKSGFGKIVLDERDRSILNRAPFVQTLIVVLSLAAWAMVLTEMYRDEGAIPIIFPTLIFGSVLLLNTIGLAIGILLGYWSETTHAEG